MSHPSSQTLSKPGIVCLHANASSSSQWRALTSRLAHDHRVFTPDTLGAGQGPAWPAGRAVSLRDEVALLEPVFEAAGSPHFLIGHSYGAAIALMAALERPERTRALAVYEPTLFAVLGNEAAGREAASGIRAAVDDATSALAAREPHAAAQRFIDYWMGPGSWSLMPPHRQGAIAASVVNVAGWATALFSEPTPLQAFEALDMPVLYMLGAQSPESSRAVARVLTQTLRHVSVIEFSELGHMGPLTHAELVNDAIAQFLACH
jgi:pimeloyl-ACP methyl ester carboxylesterase